MNSTKIKADDKKKFSFKRIKQIKLKDIVFTLLMASAIYFMIHNLAGLNYSQIIQSMKSAELGWAIAAFLMAQLLLIPNATSMMAAVSAAIPFKLTVVLQSAIQFIGMAVPSTAGRVATNIAYLTKFGVNAATAVAQGAIDSFTTFIVQVSILLIASFFGGFNFSTEGNFNVNWVLILLIALGIIIVGAIILFTISSLRKQVISIVKDSYSALSDLFRRPKRVLALFGSNIASQIVLASTLLLTAQAYGVALPIEIAITIVVGAVLLGGVAPTPGGIGVQEAIITTGLVATGVNQNTAFAIAVTYRLFTFFLPPIWGFFSFRWLQKNGHI